MAQTKQCRNSSNSSSVKWNQGTIYDNFTSRSPIAQRYRNVIQEQPQYKTRMVAYLIENNPYNKHQLTQEELREIEVFFNNNNEGNSDPYIHCPPNRGNSWKSINSILNTKVIANTICASLRGNKEVYTKYAIPAGTILGQYIGTESTKTEFDQRFKGEKIRKLKYRMQYLCFVQGPWKMNKPLELFIDPFEKNQVNVLHRINDCRKDITKTKRTETDKNRQNCEFVSVLVNGYPTILIRTIKRIPSFQTLWIYYGHYYGLIFANKPNVMIKDHQDIITLNKLLMKPNLTRKRHEIRAKLRPIIKKEIPVSREPPLLRKMHTFKFGDYNPSSISGLRKEKPTSSMRYKLLKDKIRSLDKRRTFHDFYAMTQSLENLMDEMKGAAIFESDIDEEDDEDMNEFL